MKWIRAVLVALAVSAVFTAYNVRYPNYDPDQHIFGAMLLKDKQPDLYQKDFFFSDPAYYDYYIPWYRALAGWVVGQSAGERLLERYNLLHFPAVFFYLLGFYALFRLLTESESACWVATMAALVARANLSANAFGMGLAQSMYAYKLFYAGVPWIFYLLLRYRFSRTAVCSAFFLLGLMSNVHPILGVGLAVILAGTIACAHLPKFDGVRSAAAGLALFALGFLPFAVKYFQTAAPAAVPLTADEFWRTFSTDWGYFPLVGKGIRNFFMDAGPLLVFSVLALRKGRRETDRFFLIFAACVVLIPFAEAAALQIQSHWMNRPPIIDLEPIRASTFIYIPLYAWTVVFLAGVRQQKWVFVLASLFLFAQKEFPMRQIIREGLMKSGLYSAGRIAIWETDRQRWADLMELGSWVRQNTARDAVFFHPHYDFRFHAQRAIVVGYKDGSMMARVGGAVKVRQWLERKKTVENAIKFGDPGLIRGVAERYGCDYIVHRRRIIDVPPPASFHAIFENRSYRVYRK